MNMHLYIDKGVPVCSLIEKTLSDGSKVYDLHFQGREDGIPCRDHKRGIEAITSIAASLQHATNESVLLL